MTNESSKGQNTSAEETLRQRSFIELAQALTAQKSNTLGRPLTYCLTTFGCQMNEKQSEAVAGIMDEIGYHRQDNEEADVVIYNTCTVRENANLKVYGRLGHLHSLKDHNPDMKIILFGCMMQEQHVVDKIKKSYPFVNLVFGTHNIFKYAELFYEMLQSEQQIFRQKEIIHLNQASILCLDATISAVTALSHMCVDVSEAVSRRQS